MCFQTYFDPVGLLSFPDLVSQGQDLSLSLFLSVFAKFCSVPNTVLMFYKSFDGSDQSLGQKYVYS